MGVISSYFNRKREMSIDDMLERIKVANRNNEDIEIIETKEIARRLLELKSDNYISIINYNPIYRCKRLDNCCVRLVKENKKIFLLFNYYNKQYDTNGKLITIEKDELLDLDKCMEKINMIIKNNPSCLA